MIKSIRNKRKKVFALASAIVSAILIVASCTDTTGPLPEPPGGPPWAATDSAWKVIENLRYAYITIDLELYMSCFRDDFEFWPIPVQQDSFWGYDIEEQFHQNMFDYVEGIELLFWGDTESSWSGDSTGQSLALVRFFDLKVYCDLFISYTASGSTVFICRQDSADEWYVWKWFDHSDTKEIRTWGEIKALF